MTQVLDRGTHQLCWSEMGNGTPVLFIHGTAASLWGDLTQQMTRCARVIEYDRRAFGKSRGSFAPHVSAHVEDALTVLDACGAQKAVIVGWSIGGVIAAELAVSHPNRVLGLILLEPPFWAKKYMTPNLFNGVGLSILWGMIAGPARGGRRFTQWVFKERSGGSSLDRLDEKARDSIAANFATIGMEIRLGTGEHLTSEQLKSIKTPTVVVAGDRSHSFFEEGSRRMAQMIPNAQFTHLPDASHFLQIEKAIPIARLIQDFMAKTGSSST